LIQAIPSLILLLSLSSDIRAAVKCNPDREILKTLALMGVNFDCASRPEIEAVMSLGVSTDRIIYSNPCKQKSHLSFARDVGVNLSVFDDVAELYKFKECHPRCKLLVCSQFIIFQTVAFHSFIHNSIHFSCCVVVTV
jgi:diaminopimelate decarboxylase